MSMFLSVRLGSEPPAAFVSVITSFKVKLPNPRVDVVVLSMFDEIQCILHGRSLHKEIITRADRLHY